VHTFFVNRINAPVVTTPFIEIRREDGFVISHVSLQKYAIKRRTGIRLGGFGVQPMMYATPVVYPLDVVEKEQRR
jgi:hypothetical protein